MTTFKPIRRKVLHIIGASSLVGCASRADIANATASGQLKTPTQPEGPFYPTSWAGDIDNNLVKVDQRDAYSPELKSGADSSGSTKGSANGQLAPGTPLVLRGRILRADGTAAANAQVDIWQTDHTGQYRHPNDAGDKPLKRGFQGFGRTQTDGDGRYEFVTVKPAHYTSRPPHIHFRVDDGDASLITQMYFAGENQEGGLLARAGSLFGSSDDRSLLTVTPVKQAQGPMLAKFDIYL